MKPKPHLARLIKLLAITIAAAAGLAQPAVAQVDPRATAALGRMDPWLRSVVMVRVTCATGTWSGAGVLVRATGEVLTAAHVGSRCFGTTRAKVGRIRSLYSAPGQELDATLVQRIADSRTNPTQANVEGAEFQDLAVWKIDDMSNANLQPARLATTFPMPGEVIEIVGFSAQPFLHSIVGSAGANAGPGLTRFRTFLTSVGASATDVPYRLHYPGYTLEGVSGGPVFNAAGELIGIHSTRDPRDIESALQSGCASADRYKNCVAVMVPNASPSGTPGTVGLVPGNLMSMLDSYSWATSIHAIPAGWLP